MGRDGQRRDREWVEKGREDRREREWVEKDRGQTGKSKYWQRWADQRQRRAKEGREDTEKRHKMSALDEYQCKVREGTDKSEVSHRHLSTVLKQT